MPTIVHAIDYYASCCIDINECAEAVLEGQTLCQPQLCQNIDGGFVCFCPPGMGATCGPCPMGLEGDGIRCTGKWSNYISLLCEVCANPLATICYESTSSFFHYCISHAYGAEKNQLHISIDEML